MVASRSSVTLLSPTSIHNIAKKIKIFDGIGQQLIASEHNLINDQRTPGKQLPNTKRSHTTKVARKYNLRHTTCRITGPIISVTACIFNYLKEKWGLTKILLCLRDSRPIGLGFKTPLARLVGLGFNEPLDV